MKPTFPMINEALLQSSMTTPKYHEVITELFADNKTTGTNHSEAMLHYTRLNLQRIKRLNKTLKLTDATKEIIQSIDRKMIWLTLSEAWCADAAQIMPAIEKMADLNDNIAHRYILRDEHLEVMDAFLTNGARAIPKVIFIDAATLEVLGDWGPRPEVAQQMIIEAKMLANPNMSAVKTELQKWYNKDKAVSTQQEFLDALKVALSKVG